MTHGAGDSPGAVQAARLPEVRTAALRLGEPRCPEECRGGDIEERPVAECSRT